jgi:hypothetical protein
VLNLVVPGPANCFVGDEVRLQKHAEAAMDAVDTYVAKMGGVGIDWEVGYDPDRAVPGRPVVQVTNHGAASVLIYEAGIDSTPQERSYATQALSGAPDFAC